MKRCIVGLGLMMMVCGCTIGLDKIAVPVDTHILQLGVGAQWAPLEESYSFFRVSPLWIDNDRVFFGTIAAINGTKSNGGLSVTGINFADHGWGFSASAIDLNDDFAGVNLAAINACGKHNGIQLGIFNSCDEDSHNMQIGLINWNGSFPFPIINFATGKDEPESEVTSAPVPANSSESVE